MYCGEFGGNISEKKPHLYQFPQTSTNQNLCGSPSYSKNSKEPSILGTSLWLWSFVHLSGNWRFPAAETLNDKFSIQHLISNWYNVNDILCLQELDDLIPAKLLRLEEGSLGLKASSSDSQYPPLNDPLLSSLKSVFNAFTVIAEHTSYVSHQTYGMGGHQQNR